MPDDPADQELAHRSQGLEKGAQPRKFSSILPHHSTPLFCYPPSAQSSQKLIGASILPPYEESDTASFFAAFDDVGTRTINGSVYA